MPPAKPLDHDAADRGAAVDARCCRGSSCAPILLIWGTDWFKVLVNPIFTWNYPVPDLHNMINKVPPVVAKPTPEGAVFAFTYLSFTGTGMLIAAIISGLLMGFSPAQHHRRIWPHHQALRAIR